MGDDLYNDSLSEGLRYLAAAMDVPGALPVLEMLSMEGVDSSDCYTWLEDVLASSAIPALSRLFWSEVFCSSTDVEALVRIVEERARRVDCQSIRALNWKWLGQGGYEGERERLLQAVLPSAEQLPFLLWHAVCQRHFLRAPPLNLREVAFLVRQSDAFPPPEVFEAMPSLERFGCKMLGDEDALIGTTPPVVRTITSAFSQGVAFRCLREFRLEESRIHDGDFAALLDAIAKGPCAPHLEVLSFGQCGIGPQGVARLATLIG